MRLNVDRSIALTALIVSLMSASMSFLQYRASKHYAQLALQPHLTVTPYLEGNGHRNGLYISNEGSGAAYVKSIKVVVDGRTYEGLGDSPWTEIVQAMGLDAGCFAHGWPESDTAIQPGREEVFLARTNAPNRPDCDEQMVKFLGLTDMKYTIGYASADGVSFTFEGHAKINDSALARIAAIAP